jgi:hypothetical protein
MVMYFADVCDGAMDHPERIGERWARRTAYSKHVTAMALLTQIKDERFGGARMGDWGRVSSHHWLSREIGGFCLRGGGAWEIRQIATIIASAISDSHAAQPAGG